MDTEAWGLHPEEPITRKMSPAQEKLLRRVVKTNGGGISVYREDRRVIDGLVKRHFVQGKAGALYIMVHTREGLEWVRSNPPR